MQLRRRRVSEVMQAEVVTLGSGDTLDLTQDLMRLGRVRHIPVVDDGALVGIVSNRDLLEASLSKALAFDPGSRRTFLRSVSVGEVMAKDVVSVAPETTLEEAARTIVERQIGCLPVVGPGGTLLGLVTETDLVSAAFLDEARDAEGGEEGRVIDVTTDGFQDWIRSELDDLRRIRDELKVRSHLAKAELRDTWEKLEGAFRDLERHAKQVAQAAKPPLQQLESDARKLARDLRDGYRSIRDSL